MRGLRQFFARLANLLHPSRAERELAREVASHLTLLEDEYRRRGFADADARIEARRVYGSVAAAKELHRDERSFRWLEQFVQDVRLGARSLRKSPAFSIVALLTLALGIGANTAIFSIINVVLLNPLRYPNAVRLVALTSKSPGSPLNILSFSKFRVLQERTQTLSSVAAYYSLEANLTTPTGPEQVHAAHVSHEFFRQLGAAPMLGRDFLTAEDEQGGGDVALISEGLWRAQLGADGDIVGKVVTIDGRRTNIIGVLPASFRFPILQPEPDVWLPRVFENPNVTMDRVMAGAMYLFVVGRLREGQSLAAMQAEADSICAAYRNEQPNFPDAVFSVDVQALASATVAGLRPALVALMVAVGFVLMIACVNVANLVLARATTRGKEIAVRRALGASRSRLIRQLLTESFLLSFQGGILGILGAWWGLPLLLRALPAGTIPLSDQVHVDRTVLLFSIVICVLTGVAFGLIPAVSSSRDEMHDSLKESTRGSSGRRGTGLRPLLVIGEVALALVLMTGAGLLIRSLVRLTRVNPGFDTANILTVPFTLPTAQYSTPAQRIEFIRRFTDEVQGLPGVASAALVNHLPFTSTVSRAYMCTEGTPCLGAGRDPLGILNQVTPGYFGTMGIAVLSGRDFNASDSETSRRVVVINRTIADRYFRGLDPIGRHVMTSRDRVPMEIVGVVAPMKSMGLNSPVEDEMYVPATQANRPAMTLVVRSSSNWPPLISAIRKIGLKLNPDLAFARIQGMDEVVSGSLAQPRFVAQLVGTFAGLALLLATIGIYGVMAYLVTQRSREIAIRMAIGARRSDIFNLVIGHGFRLIGIGVAIGLAGSLAMAHFLATLLFGLGATDAITLCGVACAFSIAGLAACYLPARRAMRVDAQAVLRSQ